MMTVYEDRWYQTECENALIKDVLMGDGCHPLAVVPTGGGKTKILGSVIYKILDRFPNVNIVVLSHTESILRQDHAAIERFFPGIAIGLYSSGLGSRTITKITVAGIQSIYRHPELFQDFHIAIIDEAHTVPTKGNGMYRKFFDEVDMIRVGLTATHFRSGHGYLHEGRGRMFTKLSYDLSSIENFNRLVDEGYLTTLISKPTDLEMDIEGIKKSAGDFNQKDLAERFDRDSITNAAVDEVINMGHNYKSWLIFAIDIDHAESICEKLVKNGINAKALHSRSGHDRRTLEREFISKQLRCLVSVGMVTTGFDAPNVDLLVLLRPTMSPVLHVQMIGRGLRVADGKSHCLVLDFAGNVARLGPINAVQVPVPGNKKGPSKPIIKSCPECGCMYHPSVRVCDACGHEFEFQQKISADFDDIEVVAKQKEKKEVIRWVDVDRALYEIYEKPNSPDMFRVKYKCGMRTVTEYVCYNHSGYAKHKANNWVQFRWTGEGFPMDVNHLFRESGNLKVPSRLLIDFSSKYLSIKDAIFK